MISAANNTGYENLNADSDQDHASQDGCSPCKAGTDALTWRSQNCFCQLRSLRNEIVYSMDKTNGSPQ